MPVCEFIGIDNESPIHPSEIMYECCHGKRMSWDTARRVLRLTPATRIRRKKMSNVTEAQEELLEHKANCVLCMHLPDSEVDTSCHEGMHLLKRWNEVMEA